MEHTRSQEKTENAHKLKMHTNSFPQYVSKWCRHNRSANDIFIFKNETFQIAN